MGKGIVYGVRKGILRVIEGVVLVGLVFAYLFLWPVSKIAEWVDPDD